MGIKKSKEAVYVNGIYLTEAAVNTIDFMQTGGTLPYSTNERKFNNSGLDSLKTDLADAGNLIVKAMLDESIKTKKAISLLHLIKNVTYFLEGLAAPAPEKK
jgi:hypothetical protein